MIRRSILSFVAVVQKRFREVATDQRGRKKKEIGKEEKEKKTNKKRKGHRIGTGGETERERRENRERRDALASDSERSLYRESGAAT